MYDVGNSKGYRCKASFILTTAKTPTRVAQDFTPCPNTNHTIDILHHAFTVLDRRDPQRCFLGRAWSLWRPRPEEPHLRPAENLELVHGGQLSGRFSASDRPPQASRELTRLQLVHSVALLVTEVAAPRNVWAKSLFTAGMAMFSGSIYLLVLDPQQFKFAGPVTPLGGSCLIAAWVALAFGGRGRLGV